MSSAWVLEFGGRRRAAVGIREQVHLLPSPITYELPTAPAFCRHLLFWNERVVPVLDLGWVLNGQTCGGARQLLGIYAYERDAATLDVGALWLAEPPKRVPVDDSMACGLPPIWQRLAAQVVSCFSFERQPVPILDLGAVFSGSLTRVASMPHHAEDAARAAREVRSVRRDVEEHGAELAKL